MADKYLKQVGGVLTEQEALTSSAGAGDAGKIPATGSDGRLHQSFLPTGIGADTAIVQASEALAAGDLVNIHVVTGEARVRKADASTTGKEAHAQVLAGVDSGDDAELYFEGTNAHVTGLTPGVQYLSASTPGRSTDVAPSGSGQVIQRVGLATSATSLNFEAGEPIVLA